MPETPNKQYVGPEALVRLVAHLRSGWSRVGHEHNLEDITDYVVDDTLSSSSVNPVQNKVVNLALSENLDAAKIYTDGEIGKLTSGSTPVKEAEKADNATMAEEAKVAQLANQATEAVKATKDGQDRDIVNTYETKTDAIAKLNEAKTYADDVKNDLLNGAGPAYDTLKELGELIDDNRDAIAVLNEVAVGKADKEHTHTVSDITDMPEIANADWNENDEMSAAYIQNRPFYVSGYSVGFDSAQDGVSESGYIDMYMRYVGSYNVDEWTTSAESLVGATIAGSNLADIFGTNRTDIENENGVTYEQVVTYDDCVSVGADSSYVMFEGANKACIVFVSETDAGTTAFDLPCYGATGSTMQITFPSAGMWVMKYASSVQITSIEFREYKTLDEKFIPDTIARKTEVDEALVGKANREHTHIVSEVVGMPATAAVGQTIVAKTINENGTPIEWEAADLGNITIDEDGNAWFGTAEEIYKIPEGLPDYTNEDEGKILSVVDGMAAWTENRGGSSSGGGGIVVSETEPTDESVIFWVQI